MYDWRNLTPSERAEILSRRKLQRRPWHRPPHTNLAEEDRGEGHAFHLTAACFEHRPIVGLTPKRMGECEETLLEILQPHCEGIHAWCILPNHYHVLTEAKDLKAVFNAVGRFHGRQSHAWNGEESLLGRRVWYSCSDRAIRSESHFWATMNYVHHNSIRHGYARRWTDWPFSSAAGFLEQVGKEEAARIWQRYPLFDYGKDWDPPGM